MENTVTLTETNETLTATVEQNPLTLAYETEVCGRCGGSGHYSYCQMYGTRCFGCSGKGRVYTKRGTAALAYARTLRTVKASEVQVGWLLWNDGGPFSKAGWFTVTAVGREDGSRYMGKDEEWHPYFMLDTSQGGIGTFEDSMVQAVPDKATLRDVKVKALEYQATLTKTGTVRKRASR